MSTFTIYNVPAGHDPLWVAAGQNGSILYSSDATTWIEYQAPAGDVTKNQDISFGKDGAGNDMWLAARLSNTSEIMTSSDPSAGVDSWTTTNLPGDRRTQAAEYSINGTWIVTNANQIKEVFRSTDGGVTWATQAIAATVSTEINAIATDGVGNWVILSRGGKILKSVDDGITWGGSKSTSVWFNKIAYGNGTWVATSRDGAFVCDDLSSNIWNNLPGGNSPRTGITHISGNTWIGGGYADRKIWKSVDNGSTWAEVQSIPWLSNTVQATEIATDGSIVIAVTSLGDVLKSTDLGESWVSVYNGDPQLYSVEYNKVKPF
jgi:photosystem II stability/assembly factor-like uncharacterized protein